LTLTMPCAFNHAYREGNCWDNAPTDSLWGRLKVGRPYGKTFATRRLLRPADFK
jgi:hypothetical protein